ncbi:hypothetical protein mvi_42190 [Methylobacterium indicum]|uniref:Uncharacterized protein n=1 Tax=Methylobacterium indicum TaxID=1775910 RepID=A0A8H9C886_9HYPH|nr:hypothetical protein mvi_42190 [Methylobacterium indicum]
MHQPVEERPAAELAPGEQVGDREARQQARQRRHARHQQAEPERAPLVGGEDQGRGFPLKRSRTMADRRRESRPGTATLRFDAQQLIPAGNWGV